MELLFGKRAGQGAVLGLCVLVLLYEIKQWSIFSALLVAPQALMENTQDEMNQVGISSD